MKHTPESSSRYQLPQPKVTKFLKALNPKDSTIRDLITVIRNPPKKKREVIIKIYKAPKFLRPLNNNNKELPQNSIV